MADHTNTTTQAQDAIKAELLERLDKAQDVLCDIGDALDGLEERLNPAPAPLPDVVNPLQVYTITAAREEWDAACQMANELRERIRDFTREAMRRVKVSTTCRNRRGWMVMCELYAKQISREADAAEQALHTLAFSVQTAAHLVTFAECDTVPDGMGAVANAAHSVGVAGNSRPCDGV